MKNGIYQIQNLLNSKRYIGSAAEKRGFKQRWAAHKSLLTQGKHHSIKLQRAWNKYGADAFVFEVLLCCDPGNCLMYEQIALDHYKPEYNMSLIAGSPMSGLKHSRKSKNKIRAALSGRRLSITHRTKIGIAHRGMKRSQQAKDNMSKNHANFNGEKNGNAILTKKDVILIKQLLSRTTLGDIAQRFNVAISTIANIKYGKTWSHIQ